jgi:hypothetical protein
MTVVTEEEAIKNICILRLVAAAGNGALCIGPRCMAWRWVKGSEKASVGRGYCGLAGRP